MSEGTKKAARAEPPSTVANWCLRQRIATKRETGLAPLLLSGPVLQTSALPLGYGAEGPKLSAG